MSLFPKVNKWVAAFLVGDAAVSGGIVAATEVLKYGERHPQEAQKHGRYSPELFARTAADLRRRAEASFVGPRR